MASLSIKKLNVLVFDDIPTPYRLNLFSDIAKSKEVSLSVIYLSRRGVDKNWNLPMDRLNFSVYYLTSLQYHVKKIDTVFRLSCGSLRFIRDLRPDVIVVGGYHHLTYWQVLLYCKFYNIPLVVWSGTTHLSEWHKTNRLLKTLKKIYLNFSTRCMAYGSAAKRYLESLGVPGEKVDVVINTTDLNFFRSNWKNNIVENEVRVCARFLYFGRITPLKGIQNALQALAIIYKDQQDFEFRIVGEGHFKKEIEDLSLKLGLSSQVKFVGFAQQDSLGTHLEWADVFIFSSLQEVWGIVVNEAIASGLFVLSSTRAGATEDIIRPYFSGISIEPDSIESITSGVKYCIENIDMIRQLRDKRSIWVQQFSSNQVSKSFIFSVQTATGREK